MSEALGTARWATDKEVATLVADEARGGKLQVELAAGATYLGCYVFDKNVGRAVAGNVQQHTLVCMGPRGGKGTSVIVPNLLLHRGSCVVIDPKGENATVTAARRGDGSEYARGMGQKVYVLDPFDVSSGTDRFRARYNPLDAIENSSDEAIDIAGRIADAIVTAEDGEAHWNESARSLIKALILHVASSPLYADERNLITVRTLLTRGDWKSAAFLASEAAQRKADTGLVEKPLDPYALLWYGMQDNAAFHGVVAGAGTSALSTPDREMGSILSTAKRHTEFMDSPAMRRCLEVSDLGLHELKTDPHGVSVYLSLPTRYMSTHYRWLRMLVTLILDEMERIKHQPKSGAPVLMILDEFAGLKRMSRIEDATAQIPGYGVRLMFIVQSLVQLKEIYKDNWETFVASCGIKIFAANDDPFTLTHITKRLGEKELSRSVQSASTSADNSRLFQRTETVSEGIQLHKRALMNEDEVARAFASSEGTGLVFLSGYFPFPVLRMSYFAVRHFQGMFDPHPDHPSPPTLADWAAAAAREEAEAQEAARARAEAARQKEAAEQEKRKLRAERNMAMDAQIRAEAHKFFHTVRRSFNFDGRAGRHELVEYVVLAMIGFGVIGKVLASVLPMTLAGFVVVLLAFALLSPVPALVARRYRDTGKDKRYLYIASGFLVFVLATNGWGAFFLTMLLLLAGLAAIPSANTAPTISASTSESDTVKASPNATSSAFLVELQSPGNNIVAVIRALREARKELGLAEAKQLVDSAPTIVLRVHSKQDAERAASLLGAAGAEVRMLAESGPVAA